MVLTIGVFLSDIISVFKSAGPRCRFKFLTAKGSAEEKWVRQFVERDDIVRYRLDSRHPTLEKNSFKTIFRHSSLASGIGRRGITHLLLTVDAKSRDTIARWAYRNNVTIIGSSVSLMKKLENKIWFDRFLRRHRLPVPDSQYWQPATEKLTLPLPLVVQKPVSEGGEGTYFIRTAKDVRKLLKDKTIGKQRLLVRRWVTGTSFGLSILITHDGITLSALRQQCFGRNGDRAQMFNGIQWLPTPAIKPFVPAIDEMGRKLGEALREENFFGLANIDAIVSQRGKISIIECNPRLSMATPQIIAFPELMGGFSLVDQLVIGCLPRSTKVRNKFSGIPLSSFSGSVLLLRERNGKKCVVKTPPAIGLYGYSPKKISFLSADVANFLRRPKQFIYFSLAEENEAFPAHDDLGWLVSNFPLFENGTINADGKNLLTYFQPT